MNPPIKSLPITDIIGVLLVIVALVSAGGICYIASEYTKISDTIVSASADISSLRFIRNNATGEVTISILVTLDNPSDLDLDIYRIEYQTFVDMTTATLTSFDRYVGSGSTNNINGTIEAGSIREVQISHVILPDSLYMERLDYALDGDSTLWAYTGGFLWFKISDYPDVTKKLAIGYLNQVVVQDV